MKSEWKVYPATSFLLAVTVVVFLLMQLRYPGQASSAQAIFEFGGMYGEWVKLRPSQLWRLVMPIFVHIGWQHILMNGITLYFLGHLVEKLWGSRRFLLLYLLAGIFGNVVTMVLTPNILAAGASTSLFGLFAALVVAGYASHNPYLKQLGRSYQSLLVLNLLFNLFMPDVSLVGHLGGLIGGALASVFISPSLFSHKYRWLVGVLYISLILLLCFFFYFG